MNNYLNRYQNNNIPITQNIANNTAFLRITTLPLSGNIFISATLINGTFIQLIMYLRKLYFAAGA